MPPGMMNQTEKKLEVLRHLHSVGRTLRECGDKMRMNRKMSTLLDYAKQAGLVFPDHAEVLEEMNAKRRLRDAARREKTQTG